MDHETYLGATLAAIAREKAGVLRPGRVTVLGAMSTDARIAILREAAAWARCAWMPSKARPRSLRRPDCASAPRAASTW